MNKYVTPAFPFYLCWTWVNHLFMSIS